MKNLNLLLTIISLCILAACSSKVKTNPPTTSNDSIKQPSVDSTQVVNWDGTYAEEFGGALTITNFNYSTGFDFEISIVTNTESDDACTGEVSGKAILGKSNNASFDLKDKDSECHLTFVFNGKNSIEISETDCISMHGGECGFEGSYKKEY